MTDNTPSQTGSFDWAIYADATLAGLSVLLPIPFVDSAFEAFFRRRMLPAIAARRDEPLSPEALSAFNRGRFELDDLVRGCLIWPFRFLLELLGRLSRKILYFLTIKKAIDALNVYWQRAFLLDVAVQQGYLADPRQAAATAVAVDEVLEETDTSPLFLLARQVVTGPGRLVRSLFRARRGVEDDTLHEKEALMASLWSRYEGFFEGLRSRFEEEFQQALTADKPATPS